MRVVLPLLIAAAPLQQPPPPAGPPPKAAPGPTLADALVMAQAALAACKARGETVAVSVVDAAGKAKVTLSADGFGGNPATSVRKGAAVALYRMPGSAIEKDAAIEAEIAAKADTLNGHAGSMPVAGAGGTVIGGIGVTGAIAHDTDEVCARAGLAAGPRSPN